MPDNNPKQSPEGPNLDNGLDDLVNGAVRFGTAVGGSVLSGITSALDAVSRSMGGTAPREDPDSLAATCRRLDRKLVDRYNGWLAMAIIGWTFFGCFGIAALVMAILNTALPALVLGGGMTLFGILTACFSGVMGLFLWMALAGHAKAGYFGRLRTYLRALHGWKIGVGELARLSLKKPEKVRRDLLRAVANGDIPGSCLDDAAETYYLDGRLYERPRPAPAAAPEALADETPEQKFQREGAAFLAYLRDCHGLFDEATNDELDKMEKTCAAIFGFVHNHPEQLNRVRRFQEYYLPTTRKLLDTARGLGEADTANAQEIRRDIAGILATLNTAYVKLYDTLLQDISMDVSAEIDTLESMLGQDGLTHNFENDFGAKH